MGLIIKKPDGTTINTNDFGLRLVSFSPNSLPYEVQTEDVEGRAGAIYAGTKIGVRALDAELNFWGKNEYDFVLFRDEIFNLFHSNQPFYVIDELEPGKQWKVAVDPYTLERIRYVKGNIKITFKALYPYAESIGTTLTSKTFTSDVWQIGQGLITEDLVYTFTTNTFSIYNAGDIEIDPREVPLTISVQGASSNLIIKNKTNGDTWSYDGTTASNDTVKIEGIRSTKNGLSIFKNTNRQLIRINKGWNDFELMGMTGSITTSFDFKFYYL